MASLTFIAGIIAIIVGWIGMIVAGFRANANLGCLLIVLGPIMCLVFCVKNPKGTALPFGIMAFGYLMAWLSIFAMPVPVTN